MHTDTEKFTTEFNTGLEWGRIEMGRDIFLQLGKRKFGSEPTAEQARNLKAIPASCILQVYIELLLDPSITSWGDLLDDEND